MWKSPWPDAQEVFSPEEGGCLLPHINSGHCKLDSFQPQNHEEPLTERTVPHVLSVMSSLKNTERKLYFMTTWGTNVLFQHSEAITTSLLLSILEVTGVSGRFPPWREKQALCCSRKQPKLKFAFLLDVKRIVWHFGKLFTCLGGDRWEDWYCSHLQWETWAEPPAS